MNGVTTAPLSLILFLWNRIKREDAFLYSYVGGFFKNGKLLKLYFLYNLIILKKNFVGW
jgi:hypothetical protein